jgi:hypothetical protein
MKAGDLIYVVHADNGSSKRASYYYEASHAWAVITEANDPIGNVFSVHWLSDVDGDEIPYLDDRDEFVLAKRNIPPHIRAAWAAYVLTGGDE